MRVVLAIAVNTFREVVRQPLFVLVLVILAAAIGVQAVFPYFTFNLDTDMFKDLAHSSAALAIVFLVALSASSAMGEEIESRTALTVVSKPVARWQFLVGKHLGIVLALAGATAVIAAMLFLATYGRVYFDASSAERRLAFGTAQSESALEFRSLMWNQALTAIPASVLIFFQGTVLAAAAVVMATRLSRLLSVVVTFGLFLVGHLSVFVLDAVRHSTAAVRWPATLGAFVLPYLESYNLSNILSHQTADQFEGVWSYLGMAAVATVGYSAFVLLVGTFLLNRREMA